MACWGFTASEILCQTPHLSTLDSWGFFFMLMTATVRDYRAGFSSEQQEQEQLAESVTVQRTAPSQYMQFNSEVQCIKFYNCKCLHRSTTDLGVWHILKKLMMLYEL